MTWTPEKKQESFSKILEHIESGKSLRSVLDNADREIFPHPTTFYEWLEADEKFAKQYACACEARADKIFDEIIEIADAQGRDVIQKDGIDIIQHDVIARSRLQVDARKWVASKLNPKKYGDKSTTILETPEPIKISFKD